MKQFDRSFHLLLSIAVLLTGLSLIHLASIAGLDVQRSYNEGWNAYHTAAAMSGSDLYPHAPSMLFNNYPPFSFLFVGAVARLVDDPIVAGRVVSLIATLAAGGTIYAIARRMGTTKTEALFAAVLFLAKLLAVSDYVGINDPQMLAHGIGCFGFLVAIGAPRTQTRLAFAALLLALAAFTKHMLVVQPFALLIWFAFTDRASAIRFAAYGIACALAGFLSTNIALGINLLDVLSAPRIYKSLWVIQSLKDFLLVSFAPLGAGFYLLWAGGKYARLCGLYTVLAFAIGLAFEGGAGVGRNALFDAAIAGGLSAALVMHRLRPHAATALLFALACLVPPGVAAAQKFDSEWLSRRFWLGPQQAAAATSQADIAFIRNHPGPAMCERLAYCYWAGKAPEVDIFNFIQAVKTRNRNAAELVRRIDARYFSTILLERDSRLSELPSTMAAIARNYRVDHADGIGTFFVPIPPPAMAGHPGPS